MVQTTGETFQGERGRYRAYEMVGLGTSGSVFFGLQLVTNRPVAVKRLHDQLAHQPDMVARFEREAALVLGRGLEHANLVQMLDRGRDARNVPFLILEWVEGWTVAHLLAEHGAPLSGPVAASIGCQALEGLGWAHARGIVHGDIKPANLMVTREGCVRVMDLGVARAGDRPLDARVDVFALGATLYHMLTGQPPFDGPGRDRVPLDLEVVRPELPPELGHVVRRALAIEASQRFQTADEMRQELRHFAPAELRVPVPEELPTATVPLPPHALAVTPLAETYDQGLLEATAPYAETPLANQIHSPAELTSETTPDNVLSTIALDPLVVREYLDSHPLPARSGGRADGGQHRQTPPRRASARWPALVTVLCAVLVGAIALRTRSQVPSTAMLPMLIVGAVLLVLALWWVMRRARAT